MIHLLFISTDHSTVAKQCQKCADNERNNTDNGCHLVVRVIICQSKQPCNKKVCLLCLGIGKCHISRSRTACKQIDNIKVIDKEDNYLYFNYDSFTKEVTYQDELKQKEYDFKIGL